MSKERPSILDRPLSKGNREFSVSFYNLLFAEIVSYCQGKLQIVLCNCKSNPTFRPCQLTRRYHQSTFRSWKRCRLANYGFALSSVMFKQKYEKLNSIFTSERKDKRDTKILDILLFVKRTLWIKLFGKVVISLFITSHQY